MAAEHLPEDIARQQREQDLEIAREGLAIARRNMQAAWWSTIAGWCGVLLALAALIAASLHVPKAASEIRNAAADVKRLEQTVLGDQLVISSLGTDQDKEVTISEMVSGFTPFPQLRHYLIVTPLKDGDSWVQDPVTVGADGKWMGFARFGSGNLGIGEQFAVRCLATDQMLKVGRVTALPSDAVLSEVVVVTRTR